MKRKIPSALQYLTRWHRMMPLLLFVWLVGAQSCMRMRTSDAKALTAFKQKGVDLQIRDLKIGNQNVHYVTTGPADAATLFFVHGSPGSWDAFQKYLQDSALLTHFRMISVDRPGFGFSDFGKARHLDDQAKLIQSIVNKEANGQPVHLIGHSIGGPVIMRMGQLAPELYASLSVLAGSISPFDEPKERWRYVFFTPLDYLLPGSVRPSNKEIKYFKRDLYGLDTGYAHVMLPITFIHGDKDQLVTVKNVAYGFSKLQDNPNVDSIIISGANHFIPWSHYPIIHKHLMGLVQ